MPSTYPDVGVLATVVLLGVFQQKNLHYGLAVLTGRYGEGKGMLTRSPRLFLSRVSGPGGHGAQVISGSLAGLSLSHSELAFMGLFLLKTLSPIRPADSRLALDIT